MYRLIKKYHLKEGLFVAILFPVIFFILNYDVENKAGHFIFSLIIIFSFWVINASLFHFKKKAGTSQLRFVITNFVLFLVSCLLTILLYAGLAYLLNHWSILVSQQRGNWANSAKEWYYLSVKIIVLNAIIVLIKYLVDTSEQKQQFEFENEVLKRENLHAVHEALKQQVNPHFLFNSLNTLRSLIKRNPEQATMFTEELSNVYRYMLLHQNKNIVTLADEIEFLKSYLYLLKIRFGDSINAEINLPAEELHYIIPPNTLQPLIENAVKHNIASLKKPLLVSIFLQDHFLGIKNNLQPKKEIITSSGLGLSNIRHRYQLIMGKDITIEKTPENFTVFLPLN